MSNPPRPLSRDGSALGVAAAATQPSRYAGPRWLLLGQIRRDHWMVAGIAIVVLIAALAILAPSLPLADPDATHPASRLAAPGELGYPLGSDQLGRDMLSRLVW